MHYAVFTHTKITVLWYEIRRVSLKSVTKIKILYPKECLHLQLVWYLSYLTSLHNFFGVSIDPAGLLEPGVFKPFALPFLAGGLT